MEPGKSLCRGIDQTAGSREPLPPSGAGPQSEGKATGNKSVLVLASSQWTAKDLQEAKADMQSPLSLVRMGVMPGSVRTGTGIGLRR